MQASSGSGSRGRAATERKRSLEEPSPSLSSPRQQQTAPPLQQTVQPQQSLVLPQLTGAAALQMQSLIAPVTWIGERLGAQHFSGAQFAGRVYYVNDTVLLQSGTSVPFVCRIERMLQKGPRKVMFVRWLFRPGDLPDAAAVLKRQPYAQEVFMTDVVEENEVSTILSRCYVLPPGKYAHLPAHLLDSNVFCCTMFYDSTKERMTSLHTMPRLVQFFYSSPPDRAPRLNMPEVPLSGAVAVAAPRGSKKKKTAANCSQPESLDTKEQLICSVEHCSNICWTKRPISASMRNRDWVFKFNGKYVCESHYMKDESVGKDGGRHKRSRSVSPTRSGCSDEDESSVVEHNNKTNNSRRDSLLVSSSSSSPTTKKEERRRKRAGSVDLDEGPVRSSSRLAQLRKNGLCTRGVVVFMKDSLHGPPLGEVIVHAQTTMGEVRQMIRDELGVTGSFVLQKCNIPLPRNQDSKKACLFFASDDDYLVVVPSSKN